MFAVFLPPYPFRGVKAPYLWLFLKYLHCSNEKILFITSPDYVEVINDETQHSRWEFDAASMASLGYSLPDEQSLARHEYLYLDHALYEIMLAPCCCHWSRYIRTPIFDPKYLGVMLVI